MVLCGYRTRICDMFLGCLWFIAVKAFMETCLFFVIGQYEGLALRNYGSQHGKIAEEVSEALEISMVRRPILIYKNCYYFILSYSYIEQK